MTKSTVPTETLKDFIKGQGYGVAPSAVVAICEQLLAVREAQSVPVADVVSKFGDPESFGEREIRVLADIQKMPYGTKLYTAPPAPAAPQSDHLKRALKLAGEAKELADRIQAEEQMPPAVLGEQLINIANHIAGSEGGLPDEWKDWANELVSDLRRLAASKSAPILPGDAEFKAWVHDDYNREVTLSCPVNLGIARSAWNAYRDMLTTTPKAD